MPTSVELHPLTRIKQLILPQLGVARVPLAQVYPATSVSLQTSSDSSYEEHEDIRSDFEELYQELDLGSVPNATRVLTLNNDTQLESQRTEPPPAQRDKSQAANRDNNRSADDVVEGVAELLLQQLPQELGSPSPEQEPPDHRTEATTTEASVGGGNQVLDVLSQPIRGILPDALSLPNRPDTSQDSQGDQLQQTDGSQPHGGASGKTLSFTDALQSLSATIPGIDPANLGTGSEPVGALFPHSLGNFPSSGVGARDGRLQEEIPVQLDRSKRADTGAILPSDGVISLLAQKSSANRQSGEDNSNVQSRIPLRKQPKTGAESPSARLGGRSLRMEALRTSPEKLPPIGHLGTLREVPLVQLETAQGHAYLGGSPPVVCHTSRELRKLGSDLQAGKARSVHNSWISTRSRVTVSPKLQEEDPVQSSSFSNGASAFCTIRDDISSTQRILRLCHKHRTTAELSLSDGDELAVCQLLLHDEIPDTLAKSVLLLSNGKREARSVTNTLSLTALAMHPVCVNCTHSLPVLHGCMSGVVTFVSRLGSLGGA